MMKSFTAAVLAVLLQSASATIYYAGVAESGGEFGLWGHVGQGLPGTFGVDYKFIDETGVSIMREKHDVNLFRIAFILERMCPLETGLGSTFNETYYGYYKDAVDYVTKTQGAYSILDPHNYMRYNDPSAQPMSGSVIGNASDAKAATTQDYAAFWGELAKRFKDNEKVIFSLMNEPHDMPSSLLLANLQAAVDAIRASGARNLIIAPGNSWSGGHSWTDGGSEASSEWLYKLSDPLKNLAMDVHEYLDEDYSGSHAECVNDPVEKLANLTAWLKEHKLKAFITEFGGANNTGCAKMLDGFFDYMAAEEVYLGWTYWAAGPLWGTSSPCCTNSMQWGSVEPGSTAADGSPGLYDTVFLPVVVPKIPKKLQWCGPATVDGGELSTAPKKK